MADKDTTDIKIDIESLRKDIENVNSIQGRLDTAIDRLTDVSSSIKSMLAVHEEKLSKQEDIDKAIFNLIESRRVEFDTNYKELHARINKIHKELTDEIEMSEKRLMCEIKTLNSNLDGRIGVFEKYRWIIIGAAIVLGLSMPKILDIMSFVQ